MHKRLHSSPSPYNFPTLETKMSHNSSLFLATPFLFSFNTSPNFGANSCLPQLRIPKKTRKSFSIRSSELEDSPNQQQQLNLSVLRFTFGIPGLDESYLPRWIGYAFGSLLILNHFLGSNSTTTTPAQLRTEIIGLSLAVFSALLPYIGKFLKGATPVRQARIPEGTEQIFAMTSNISDTVKDDLAWGSYVLLRNTNTISMLISIKDALCVRGYWNIPKSRDLPKDQALAWFKEQIQRVGLSNMTNAIYFPQKSDSDLWEMLPEGTCSMLVLPVLKASEVDCSKENAGFVLLASSISYAYSDKDRAWIEAIAKKFGGWWSSKSRKGVADWWRFKL